VTAVHPDGRRLLRIEAKNAETPIERKPGWIRTTARTGPNYEDLQQIAPHLAEGAIVVVERSARDSEPVWPKSVRRFAAKNYGETAVYYLEPDAAELSAEPELGIAEKEN